MPDCRVWLCALMALSASCNEAEETTTGAASRPEATATESSKPGTATEPKQAKGLRCRDFMSEEEAKSIGLEGFDAAAEQPKPNLGVHCASGPEAGLTVFHGEDLSSMKGGAERAKGVEKVEGPSIARETYWYTSSGIFCVFFLSENGNYAANMCGDKDQDNLAELGQKVAPFLNKP